MNDKGGLEFTKMKQELYKQIWLLEILERGGEGIDGDTVFVNNLPLLLELEEHYKHSSWWEEQEDFSLKNVFPERYRNQVNFIQGSFYKYLTPSDVICDLASANGEYSFMIADKVKWIDGYELSDKMAAYSRNKAQELGVSNVAFMQGNAIDIEFHKIYDNIMMMGLLTYIMEDESAEKIVEKVAGALKPGGKLMIKDSLNLGEKDLFAYNIANGYQAIYRTKENYISIFEKFGLTIEDEMVFEEQDGGFENKFISLGLIWKKL